MIRSRLRRPTSKSITAVLWPASARPEAKLALVVVLPTPPLPEVTTTILAMVSGFLVCSIGFQWLDDELGAGEPHLCRLAQHGSGQFGLGGAVDAGDGQQLRRHAGREDARARVAERAGERPPAQRRV